MGTDLFYPALYSGGEVHLLNVARSLVKLGHEVTVIAARTAYSYEETEGLKDQETIDGVNIVRTRHRFKFGATLGSIPSLIEMYLIVRRKINNGDVDIVNPSQYRPCIPFALAARNKVPCVATFHDTYSEGRLWGIAGWKGQRCFGIPGWALERLTLRLPYDKMITVSMSSKRRLSKYYAPDKISVVYNGVDLHAVDSVEAGEKKPCQVIYVGSLKEFKNVLHAVRSVELAREAMAGLELVIVSTGGPQEELVRKVSQERSYVRYLGRVTEGEKTRLMKESSLLLLPSSREGFGLVLIEALSCGTPFIAYDIPAVREVCNLTKGGILVEHMDYEAMAGEICHLLKDKSLLEDLAVSGRREVENTFTWDEVARREEETFRSLLDVKLGQE